MSKCQSCGVNEEKAVKQSRTVTNAQEEKEDCEGRGATQNLAQTRKGKKTAGKDFRNFRESA